MLFGLWQADTLLYADGEPHGIVHWGEDGLLALAAKRAADVFERCTKLVCARSFATCSWLTRLSPAERARTAAATATATIDDLAAHFGSGYASSGERARAQSAR